MRALAKNRFWYMIFAVLLLYATTGDFMATSMLFVNGHDCDHPWVRIEHKCITKSADKGKEKKQAAVSRPGPVSNLPAVSAIPTQGFEGYAHAVSHIHHLPRGAQDPVPLRC